MSSLSRFLTSRWGPILTGIAVGVLAPMLVKLGNPGNMGICVACFSRDIAGALGLHRAAAVQYIRPEIIGFVLGSLVAALSSASSSRVPAPLRWCASCWVCWRRLGHWFSWAARGGPICDWAAATGTPSPASWGWLPASGWDRFPQDGLQPGAQPCRAEGPGLGHADLDGSTAGLADRRPALWAGR